MILDINNENHFVHALTMMFLDHKKLIFAQTTLIGNSLAAVPALEVRDMATAGGAQFGMAEIGWDNRRGSGIYTMDPEEIYIRCLDYAKKHPNHQWILVDDVEHTYFTSYSADGQSDFNNFKAEFEKV